MEAADHELADPGLGDAFDALSLVVLEACVLDAAQDVEPALVVVVDDGWAYLFIEIWKVIQQEPPATFDIRQHQQNVPEKVKALSRLRIHIGVEEDLEVESLEFGALIVLNELCLQISTLTQISQQHQRQINQRLRALHLLDLIRFDLLFLLLNLHQSREFGFISTEILRLEINLQIVGGLFYKLTKLLHGLNLLKIWQRGLVLGNVDEKGEGLLSIDLRHDLYVNCGGFTYLWTILTKDWMVSLSFSIRQNY